MKKEQQEFQPIKLQFDISPIYANKNTATSIHNLRIESNEDKSKLALTLEKKLKEGLFENFEFVNPEDDSIVECSFCYNNSYYKFSDTNIKHITSCTSNCFVVFLNTPGFRPNGLIVKIEISPIGNEPKVLYYGKAFNDIIQSEFVYETDTLQKVYWIEKNVQPRVINIVDTTIEPSNRILDFIPSLPSMPLNVEIVKESIGGQWSGGAIKYLITYCNPYMQESNIAYYSSLYFTSIDGYGINPDGSKLSSEKFILKVSGGTNKYTHIRVYRIFYSSLDQPVGYDLGYYPLPSDGEEIIITDEGNLNPSATLIDINSSRFYGIHPISPNTMEIKDNHILFGGYKLLDNNLDDTDSLEYNSSIPLDLVDYTNVLNLSSNPSLDDLTFFHKNESYLFGLQLMSEQGVWSNVISVKEFVPEFNLNSINFKLNYKDIPEGYIAARLVCNYPTPETRNFIAQGAINHTIYDRQKKGYYQSDYLLTNYKRLYYPEVSYNFTESMYKDEDSNEFYSGEALTRTDNVLSFLSPEFNDNLNDEYWRLDTVYAQQDRILTPGKQKYGVFLDVKNPLQPIPSSYTSSSINSTVLNTKSYIPNLSIVLPTYYGNKKDNIPSYKHGNKYEYSAYDIPLWKSQSSLNNASSMSPSMGKITSTDGVETLETDPTQRQYKLEKKIISRLTTFESEEYPESDFEIFNFKHIQGKESSIHSLKDGNIFYLSNPQTMYTVGSNKYYIKVFENFTKSYAEKGDVYGDTNLYKYADDSLKLRVTPAGDASDADPAKEGFMTGAMNISYKNGSHALLYKDSLNIDSISDNLLDAGSPFAAMLLSLCSATSKGGRKESGSINVDVGQIWHNEDRGIGVLAASANNNKKNVCGSIVTIDRKASGDYTYLSPLTNLNGYGGWRSFSPYCTDNWADHERTRGRFVKYNENFDSPDNGLGFKYINSSYKNSHNTLFNLENRLSSVHNDFIRKEKNYFVKFPTIELDKYHEGPYFGLSHNGIRAISRDTRIDSVEQKEFNTLPVYYYSPKEDEEVSAYMNIPNNSGDVEDRLQYVKDNIKDYFKSLLLLSAVEVSLGNGVTSGSLDTITSFKKTYGGGSTAVGLYWLFDTYSKETTEDMIGASGVEIASVPPEDGKNIIYDASWGTTNNRGSEARFTQWANLIDSASEEELSSFMLEYLSALDYVEEEISSNTGNLFKVYARNGDSNNYVQLKSEGIEIPLTKSETSWGIDLKLEGPKNNGVLAAVRVSSAQSNKVRIIIPDGPHKYDWDANSTNVVASKYLEKFKQLVEYWKENKLCEDDGIPCDKNGNEVEGDTYEYKLYKGHFNAQGVLVNDNGDAVKYKHPYDNSYAGYLSYEDVSEIEPYFVDITLEVPKKDSFSPYYKRVESEDSITYYYFVNTDSNGENNQKLNYTLKIDSKSRGHCSPSTPSSVEGITYSVSALDVDWTQENDTILYVTGLYKKVYEIYNIIQEKVDKNPSSITFARKAFTIKRKEGDLENSYSLYANWKDKFALFYTTGLWEDRHYNDTLIGGYPPHPILTSKDKYINNTYIQYNLIGNDSYVEGDAGSTTTKKYYLSPYAPIGLIRVYPNVKDVDNYKEYVYYAPSLNVKEDNEDSVMKPLSTLLPEDKGSVKNTKLLINNLEDIKYLYRNYLEEGESSSDINKIQSVAINPEDIIKGLDTSTLGIKTIILLPVNNDYIKSSYSPYNIEGGYGRTKVTKNNSNLILTTEDIKSTGSSVNAVQIEYDLPIDGKYVSYVGEAPIEVSLSIKKVESKEVNGAQVSTGWFINDSWKYKVALTKEADNFENEIKEDNYGISHWEGDRGLEDTKVVSIGVAEYSVDISNFESNPTPKTEVKIPIYSLYRNREAKTLYNEIDYSNLIWQVCSKSEYIYPYVDRNTASLNLSATVGDCYFGKYQHLLTVPYNEEITNQLIDINEFTTDTHINLLGRYDNRKELLDHTQTRLENFNKINPVYNQKDNFLRGVYLDQNKLYNTEFPNQIMYSLNKVAGGEEDFWTSINPISGTYDTDGSLGAITALTDNNGVLYCFHEEGIELVSFNSRVQVAASDGIPIELANSNKLDNVITFNKEHGLRTISHLVNTDSGIFFLDSRTKGLCTLANRQVVNLSYNNNVMSYYENNKDYFDSMQLLYDDERKEIYTLTPNNSLLYSINFNAFVGTFNYNTNYKKLFKFDNSTYLLSSNISSRIDQLHGEDSYYPDYEVSFITNDVSTQLLESVHFISSDNDTEGYNLTGNDLIKYKYSNLEQSGDKPFTSLKVINDYQEGEADNKTLIRTNRVWNWSIPRQKNSRNRILNFWNMITLSNNSEEDIKENIKFYGFNITYYK